MNLKHIDDESCKLGILIGVPVGMLIAATIMLIFV